MYNEQLIDDAIAMQYLVIKAGGMATKSLIEDMLMLRYPIDRYTAHDYLNEVERRNERRFSTAYGSLRWEGDNEPTSNEYPEVNQVKFRIYA